MYVISNPAVGYIYSVLLAIDRSIAVLPLLLSPIIITVKETSIQVILEFKLGKYIIEMHRNKVIILLSNVLQKLSGQHGNPVLHQIRRPLST
jgi:hypothetical protein